MFFFSPSSSKLSSSKNGVIIAGNTPLNINLDLASASASLPHHIGNISCHTISYGLIFDVGIL
jgi:predicted regulator of Ras-like GTPase activity (Roadblock/LC7/MglB family)